MQKKLLLIVSISLITFTVATYGGGDWENFFIPFIKGDLTVAYHPYHLQILLYPFQYFPYYIWSSITLLVVIFISFRLETNPLSVLLTLPSVALIWAGQIDGLILIGIYLVLLFDSPLLAGASLILFSVKPHVTWLVGLIILWIYKRSVPKLLILPLLFGGFTFLIYGWDWPIRWYTSIPTTINTNYGYQSIYAAAILLPLPFFLKDRRSQLLAGFCISALLTPVGIYSFTNFLVIYCPIGIIPITWLVYILHGFGNLAFIIPILVLVGYFYPNIMMAIQDKAGGKLWSDL